MTVAVAGAWMWTRTPFDIGYSRAMGPGAVVGDLVIESAAGTGGMGSVFRARRASDGGVVALKVLHSTAPADVERFVREAEVLESLRHPAIVRHVAHGRAPSGEPFLAMEWIEGESLAARLGRGVIGAEATLDLLRRVTEGLAAAHTDGVVHRDVKPNNVMLEQADLGRPKLVDFGIARTDAAGEALTKTGVVLGTPGYMSPEQAMGARDIDARSDVFAIGCLLYRCVAGRPPFVGEHAVAVLSKTVFEQPPRLRDLAPHVPPAVDALAAALLAKDRARRPSDARAVLALLDDVARALADGDGPRSRIGAETVTGTMQRFVSALFGWSPIAERRALAAVASNERGRLVPLADGSFVVLFDSGDAANEIAVRAASCAVSVRAAVPQARLVVASGRAVVGGGGAPSGDVIDRAARALAGAPEGRVVLDDATARLVAGRYRVLRRDGNSYLDDRDDASAPPLLGRPTPCVGRERELAFLESTFEESAADEVARVVVLTAAPGTGKSRLRLELLRRLAQRAPTPVVLFGAADPVRAGTPLAVAADVLRRATRPAARTVAEHVARVVTTHDTANDAGRASSTQIVDGHADPAGRTIAGDAPHPAASFDALREAWLAWLDEETASASVALVLEDVQWADAASLQLVDDALRAFSRRPLFVLALARPEVFETFPRLWHAREPHLFPLKGLSRRAADELVAHVLPAVQAQGALDTATRDALVARADGNAFQLEELLRVVATEGAAALTTLPDTVLGMVQARFDALGPELSRVLRAASVFGSVFPRDGVAALLGRDERSRSVGDWLERLTRAEVLEPREGGLYAFRHDLMREGAYAMLVDDERVAAHGFAADWLAQSGVEGPLVLAEHYRRAGRVVEARRAFLESAQAALGTEDFAAARARAELVLSLGASGDEETAAHVVAAVSYRWRGDAATAERFARAALDATSPGSVAWYRAARVACFGAGRRGDTDAALALVDAVSASEPTAATVAEYFETLIGAVFVTARTLQRSDLVARICARADALQFALDDTSRARLETLHALAREMQGDLSGALEALEHAHELYERVRSFREIVITALNAARIYGTFGDLDAAGPLLARAVDVCERFGLDDFEALVHAASTCWSLERGDVASARSHVDRAAAASAPGFAHLARLASAAVLLAEGDARGAEAAAAALSSSEPASLSPPGTSRCAAALRARALLAAGRRAEGLAVADACGSEPLDRSALWTDVELPARALAEALVATGDVDRARRIARDACRRFEAYKASFTLEQRSGDLAPPSSVAALERLATE